VVKVVVAIVTLTDKFIAPQGNAKTKLTKTVKTLDGSLEFCLPSGDT